MAIIIGNPLDVEGLGLSRAPTNELGVVYLFGVLHETPDFNIQTIGAEFPDCIAHRRLGACRRIPF